MKRWTCCNHILNSKPFLLELINVPLIHMHSTDHMLDACWISEIPGCPHVSEDTLQPLPEILTITIQAVKEKQWALEKLRHDRVMEWFRVLTRCVHYYSHPLTPLSAKIWVNPLSKNYAALMIRSEVGPKGAFRGEELPLQEYFLRSYYGQAMHFEENSYFA